MKTYEDLKWPRLQMSLITIFLTSRNGTEFPLPFLQQKVYSTAHKRKPSSARQSTAALIRNTSNKLLKIGAEIERTSDLGHGNHGKYRLVGNITAVRKSVANSKKVKANV